MDANVSGTACDACDKYHVANASSSMFFSMIWNQNTYVCKCIMYANLSCMQCSFLLPAKIATVLIEAIIPQRSCWMLRERCWFKDVVLAITSSDSSSGIITRILVLPVYSSITSSLVSLVDYPPELEMAWDGVSTSLLRNSSLWKDKEFCDSIFSIKFKYSVLWCSCSPSPSSLWEAICFKSWEIK